MDYEETDTYTSSNADLAFKSFYKDFGSTNTGMPPYS